MNASPALAWLLLFPLAAAAQSPPSGTWQIDPAASQVQFTIRKFWVVRVRGTFPALAGRLQRIDTHIGADLVRVDARVQVDSLTMDDPAERAHALGPAFFDAARYPAITFESDPLPLEELAAGGELRGMLELHGQRRAVKLRLHQSSCPRQPLQCVIRAKGTISRSEFGMRGLGGILSDAVALNLRIALSAHP